MGVSTNQERESQHGKESSIELTSIKVKKETAELLRIYCVFNNLKMADITTEVLDEKLDTFKKRLEEWKKLDR